MSLRGRARTSCFRPSGQSNWLAGGECQALLGLIVHGLVFLPFDAALESEEPFVWRTRNGACRTSD